MSICQDLGLNFQQRMGANISQLERDIGSEQFPPNEHYFGLVNFGNTCYSNSVLQALYFCRPFREKVLEYKAKNKRTKETLLTCLADLFYSIATQKKKVGSIAPKKFIARLRKEKEEFDNYMQQDAHEFLNFLINHINEIILDKQAWLDAPPDVNWFHSQMTKTDADMCCPLWKFKTTDYLRPKRNGDKKVDNVYLTIPTAMHPFLCQHLEFLGFNHFASQATLQMQQSYVNDFMLCCFKHICITFLNKLKQNAMDNINQLTAERNQSTLKLQKPPGDGVTCNGTVPQSTEPTWVHEIFQGTLTSETRCLNCETVSSKDEHFFDLQVDVGQNTSITHCLKCFSDTETLCNDNKFKCDNCSSYQEAQKRMRVKKLPLILALHLKRFKYMEQYNRHIKVSHRVVFPLELRLFNTSDDAVNPDRLYDLVAVVVHCGSGPNRGHYISIVKSHGFWLLFDDDMVDKIDASAIEDFYGLTSDIQKSSETGYILFYQSRDASC